MKYESIQIISRTERRKFAEPLIETRTVEGQMSACRWPGAWAEVIKRITNNGGVFHIKGDVYATAIQ